MRRKQVLLAIFLVVVLIAVIAIGGMLYNRRNTEHDPISMNTTSSAPAVVQQKPQWKVVPPEQNKMPSKLDTLEGVPGVKDQSLPASLNRQQRLVVDQYIKNVTQQYGQYENTDPSNVFRTLPDDSVLVVGRIEDYLAPTWIFRISSSGAVLGDFGPLLGHNTLSPFFIGYANGLAYIAGSFGDGGGSNSVVAAIDVLTGSGVAIEQEDSYFAASNDIEPDFLPSDCKNPPSDNDLSIIAAHLAAELDVRQHAIQVGKICGMEKVIVVPFAVPSQSKYGVIARYASGKIEMQLLNASDSNIYPPIFVPGGGSDLSVTHSFESTENDVYVYDQTYLFVNPYFDDVGGFQSGAYYHLMIDTGFCLTHSCVR